MGSGLVPNGKIYYLSASINPFGQSAASSCASEVMWKGEKSWVGGAGNQAEEEKDVKGQERWREGSESGSGEVKWREEKKDEVTMGREKKRAKEKEERILYPAARCERYSIRSVRG